MKMSKEHIVDGIFLNKDVTGLLSVADDRLAVLIKKEPISNVYHVEHTPFARGKFAAVRKCTHRESGVEYAAKFIRKRRRAMDQRADIVHEVAVLAAAAGSARIVALHEVYETAAEMALVLELASGGELQHIIDVQEGLDELQAARVMKQILEGLQFLHGHNIAHLDLKPQNLLLTGNYPDCDIKLCDFGISRVIQSGVEVREILGTPDYVAPEVLSYEPISLATDIWSVGVLAYVLVSGFSPFRGDSKQETFCNISQCKLEFPDDIFQDVSNEAKEFIRVTLNTDPRKRPSIEECLSHSWLSGISSFTNIPTSLLEEVQQSPQNENENENKKEESNFQEEKKLNGDVKSKIATWDKKETQENLGRGDFNSVKIIRDITNCWIEKASSLPTSESIKLASKGNANIVIIPLKKNEDDLPVCNNQEESDLFNNEYKTDGSGQYIHGTNTMPDSSVCLPLSKTEDDKDSPVNKKPKNCMLDRRSSFPVASCLSCAQCGSQCCHHSASHPSDIHISQHHHKSIAKSPVKITLDRSIIC